MMADETMPQTRAVVVTVLREASEKVEALGWTGPESANDSELRGWEDTALKALCQLVEPDSEELMQVLYDAEADWWLPAVLLYRVTTEDDA